MPHDRIPPNEKPVLKFIMSEQFIIYDRSFIEH